VTNSKDQRGGARPGAGRKAAFGEPTTTLRVPVSARPAITAFLGALKTPAANQPPPLPANAWLPAQDPPRLELPVGLSRVSAGFPSPAEDFKDRELDINEFLISRPKSTVFFQVDGPSVQEFGIYDGDFVVVDRSKNPQSGQIVVAFVNGERLVKKYHVTASGRVFLVAGHPEFKPLEIKEGMELEVWGVVVGKFGKVQS
jgi:DNA polymerase V